ncbi:MAG: flagellar protein FlgN [Bacillota bacterium]|nr:MAG: flagellar protein FlgN [Bacillota bacterium]
MGTAGAAAETRRQAATVLDLLARQAEQMERQIAAAERKQRALVAGDPAAIEEALREESREQERAEELERARYEAQQALARACGDRPEAVTWEFVARLLPERAAEARKLRDRVLRGIERLAALNRENGALIRQGLAWTRYSLNLLAGAGGGVYERDGRLQVPAAGRALDRSL